MKKTLLITFLATFALGFISHYAYDFIPIKLLFPTNESIFEHLKLIFYPLLVVLTFEALKNNYNINYLLYKINVTIIISTFILLIMFFAFYFIFNDINHFYNIVIYGISIFIGLKMATIKIDYPAFSSNITVFIILLYTIIFLTYSPFNIPLFFDELNFINHF